MTDYLDLLGLPFMQRALLAAVFTGLAAPAVGTYLVQRRLALMGDGIGHVAVTGVAVGLLTGASPTWTAVAVAVVGAVVIEVIRERGHTNGDVALALLFYGGLAGGVLITGLAGQSGARLQQYLFGSITTISVSDVVVTMVLRNTGNAPIALDFQRGDPARYPNLSVNIRSDDNYSHFVDGDGTRDKTSLGAGESIRTTLLWEQQISRSNRQPVARGTYRVVGFIDFDDRDQLKVEDLFIELK